MNTIQRKTSFGRGKRGRPSVSGLTNDGLDALCLRLLLHHLLGLLGDQQLGLLALPAEAKMIITIVTITITTKKTDQ